MNIPMWMLLIHVTSSVASWMFSLTLGILFGAEVGWTALVITELRVMSAAAVREKFTLQRH